MPQKGDAAKGKEVFDNNAASATTRTATEAKMGPGLKGSSRRPRCRLRTSQPTDANVLEKINEGGNGMPAYKDILSDTKRPT